MRDPSRLANRQGESSEHPEGHPDKGSPPALTAPEGPIGVLALQGSFPLHLAALSRCGVETREVRKAADLEDLRGLIVPGGESTVMALLAQKYGLFEPIRALGEKGLALFGTCAGAILLGRGEPRPPRWEIVDVEVERNAYGRQRESFSADLRLTPFATPVRGVFIRAPKIRLPATNGGAAAPDPRLDVLGVHNGNPVLVRSGRCLLSTFHPELTSDLRVHRYFLEHCVRPATAAAAAHEEPSI